jgi:large subunit ribosomal protein L37Ae
MATKTKKIKAAGKFGAGYGIRARKSYNKIDLEQRKRQKSPFYEKAKAKRIAVGIWKCMKTGRIFAGGAYNLEK